MASIVRESGGRKTIQLSTGKRPKIRLGKCDLRVANMVKRHVEHLDRCRILNQDPRDETCVWLVGLDEAMHKRIASLGLCSPRRKSTTALSDLLAAFIRSHRDTVKPATVTTWEQAERLLFEFFAPEKLVQDITAGDARDFRNYLKTRSRPLSEATVRRRCLCAKQMFAYGVDKGWLVRNPFDSKLIPTVSPRSARKEFIAPELSLKIMQELPTDWLQLVFALARWGGMRVGSEPRELMWSGIDWEKQTITFRSVKTEHHEGKETRTIPMFPELVEPLRAIHARVFLQGLGPEGSVKYVLPELRVMTDTGLRKPMLAAIEAAGGQPWKKLWTTLRATRDTELKDRFPSHVVDAWLGHSERVSRENYLMVTDEHFRQAVQNPVQNPVQKVAASSGNDRQRPEAEMKEPRGNVCFSGFESVKSGRNWT